MIFKGSHVSSGGTPAGSPGNFGIQIRKPRHNNVTYYNIITSTTVLTKIDCPYILKHCSMASARVISPKYSELDLRRTAPYLVGIEIELLSRNKIARIPNCSLWPMLKRTDIRE